MRARHGVPWFPLDALKMGLHFGAPSLGIHPDDDDLETADRMWPIIKGALEHLIWDGRDYLVEGDNLCPRPSRSSSRRPTRPSGPASWATPTSPSKPKRCTSRSTLARLMIGLIEQARTTCADTLR